MNAGLENTAYGDAAFNACVSIQAEWIVASPSGVGTPDPVAHLGEVSLGLAGRVPAFECSGVAT